VWGLRTNGSRAEGLTLEIETIQPNRGRKFEHMLTVTVERSSEFVVLHCVGRIVRGQETSVLCAAVGHHGQNVVLDLSMVDAIDAAGVGALLTLQAAGVYLTLRNPSKAVREVLRLTKLESVFEIIEVPPIAIIGGIQEQVGLERGARV
jgi:anti-anti-sigma factor